jgi:hypothetical protein
MDLEGHPVFREIKLGPDLIENSLSDVAKRSVEIIKDEQFAVHVFLFCDNDLALQVCVPITPYLIYYLCSLSPRLLVSKDPAQHFLKVADSIDSDESSD